MNLFHGTNTKFEIIDLAKSKDKRDFGKGFYTTTFYDQAEKWAKNQYIRKKALKCLLWKEDKEV